MPPPRRCAVDFVCYEALSALGWRVRVLTFQRLLVLVGGCGLLMVVALGTFGSRWLLGVLDPNSMDPGAATTWSVAALAIVVLINIYVAGGLVVREWLSRRRYAVGMSPNTAFFRTLDIPAGQVFLAKCVVRILVFTALLLAIDIPFVLTFRDYLGDAWPAVAALLSVPPAMAAVTLAVAGTNATRTVKLSRIGPAGALGVVLSAFAGGLAVAVLLERVVTAQPAGGEMSGLTALALALPWLGALMAGTVIGGLLVSFRQLRVLWRRPFPIADDGVDDPSVRHRWGPGIKGSAILGSALHAEVVNSKVLFALQRFYLAAAAIGVSLLALSTSDVVISFRSSLQTPLTTTVIVLGFVLTATATELLISVAGPTRWRRQLRFAYESGATLRSVVVGAIGYPLMQILGVGIAAFAAGWVALGVPPWQVLFIALAYLFGSLIAEAASGRPGELTDGSTQASVFVALVALLLTAPIVVASLLLSGPLLLVVPLGTAALGGGALLCTARRIVVLPSDVPG